MRKILYEIGAGLVIVFGIIPICVIAGVYSAYLTIIETAKVFPLQISTLFEIWYSNKER